MLVEFIFTQRLACHRYPRKTGDLRQPAVDNDAPVANENELTSTVKVVPVERPSQGYDVVLSGAISVAFGLGVFIAGVLKGCGAVSLVIIMRLSGIHCVLAAVASDLGELRLRSDVELMSAGRLRLFYPSWIPLRMSSCKKFRWKVVY